MTKRDFFILLLKVFGLFSLVVSLFSILPSSFSLVIMNFDTFSLVWVTIVLLIVIGLFVFLIFKSDKVVKILRLEKGFDDDKIELGNLTTSDIVKVGTFIIGGILILNNIPDFLTHTFFAFKGEVTGKEYGSQDIFDWIVCGLNLIIGYLLVTNYDFVAKRLKNKYKEKE